MLHLPFLQLIVSVVPSPSVSHCQTKHNSKFTHLALTPRWNEINLRSFLFNSISYGLQNSMIIQKTTFRQKLIISSSGIDSLSLVPHLFGNCKIFAGYINYSFPLTLNMKCQNQISTFWRIIKIFHSRKSEQMISDF